MQDGGQNGEAGRPRMTIEGTAREVKGDTEETAATPPESGDAAPDEPGDADRAGIFSWFAEAAWRERLIVVAIAAGIAVVVVFALLAGLRYTTDAGARMVAALSGASEAREDLAGLREELAALRARVASGERLEARIADLEGQAGRIEASAASGLEAGTRASETAEANAGRVTALEDRFSALDAAGAQTSDELAQLREEIDVAADAGTSASAVAARLSRESERLDALAGRIGGFEQNLSALSGDVATLATDAQGVAGRVDMLEGPEGPAGGFSELTERIAELEAQVARLDARSSALGPSVAAAAHGALAAKSREGRAFERELSVVRAVLGDIAEVDALEAHAANPPATLDELAGRLDTLSPAAGDDAAPVEDDDTTGDGGLFDRLIARAGESVRVRRVGDDADAPPGLEGAHALLDDGDLAGAIAMVRDQAAGPETENWLADAEAREALDRAVAELGAMIERRLDTGDDG